MDWSLYDTRYGDGHTMPTLGGTATWIPIKVSTYDTSFDVMVDNIQDNVQLNVPVPGATKENITITADAEKVNIASDVEKFEVDYTYELENGFILEKIDARVENGLLRITLINGRENIKITIN